MRRLDPLGPTDLTVDASIRRVFNADQPAPALSSSAFDVSALRQRVARMAEQSMQSVLAVRDSFSQGVAPLQTVNSGSVADFLDRFAGGESPDLIKSTAQLGLRSSKVGTTKRPPRPELDYVMIDNDPTYGILDGFYAKIVVSLSLEEAKAVSQLRILRATNGKVDVTRPAFSALIDGSANDSLRNNPDQVSVPAFRAAEIGVGNKLTGFISDDPFTPQRAVVSQRGLPAQPKPVNTNRQTSSAALLQIDGVDRSVVENLTFYINRRSVDLAPPVELPLKVGAKSGLNVLQGNSVAESRDVIQKGNSAQFREILRQPISVANWRQVGSFIEVALFDPSIVFGRSYTYYAAAIDAKGNESIRSRTVTLNITRQRPPLTPDVSFCVVANRPRFSVRAEGKFIDHIEVFRKGGTPPKTVRLLGSDGAMISDSDPQAAGAFYHIGDLGVGTDRSTTFIDTGVLPGQRLSYRFYSVDSFGAKSQTPFACDINIPDLGRPSPLSIPSITAEQGIGGRVMNVRVSCDDERVRSFCIKRREIGREEHGYHEPFDPAYFRFGSTDAKRARSRFGPRLAGGAKVWSGVLQSVSGSARMVDTAVGFDRTYQYIVEAFDIHGNSSFPGISKMVRVMTKPVAESPVDVGADVIVSEGAPMAVRITWSPGTDDFSPNELIGDQDVLAATSVRSVYQVERRRTDGFLWEAMPAVTGNQFIDPVSVAEAPLSRPAYAQKGLEYDYRVVTMQSGGFISNYTEPVRVKISPDLGSSGQLWVRSTDTAVRPCHVIVSWNYDGEFVDGWQIERAAVNKIFAAKVKSIDSQVVRDLPFEEIAVVRRESSRAHGLATQPSDVDPRVFVGNRYFIDQDISLDNSYFYRIRPLDLERGGDWTYGGIMLNDSPHDRKFLSTLSDDEKVSLSQDLRPIKPRVT